MSRTREAAIALEVAVALSRLRRTMPVTLVERPRPSDVVRTDHRFIGEWHFPSDH